VLLAWLLLAAYTAIAEVGEGPPLVSERVRYETAALALEQGDERLAVQLLGELAEVTGSDRARGLYTALIERAEGRLDRVDEILRELPPAAPAEAAGELGWVEGPLAVLGAERELARIRSDNDARLAEILAQHYEARGGIEKLQSLSTLLATGRLVIGDRDLPFHLARKRDRLYRFDLQTPGGPRVEAFDGNIAWGFDGPGGDIQATYLGESRGRELERLAFFDEVLVRFKTTGEKLFLKEPEIVDGRECHPIEVSADGQLAETLYLDAETLLEARRIVWTADGSQLAVREFEHKEVDGISLPASQKISIGPSAYTYHYDEYALDAQIPIEVFVPKKFNEGLGEPGLEP
jgi:hypothetical protein